VTDSIASESLKLLIQCWVSQWNCQQQPVQVVSPMRWSLLSGTRYLNLHWTKLIPQNAAIHICKTADKGTAPNYRVQRALSLWDHTLKP